MRLAHSQSKNEHLELALSYDRAALEPHLAKHLQVEILALVRRHIPAGWEQARVQVSQLKDQISVIVVVPLP